MVNWSNNSGVYKMTSFFIYILIGCGAGIIALPIFMLIHNMIARAIEGRKIKREIKRGNFLIPIDPNDFNTKTWSKDVDITKYSDDLKNLDKRIFKRGEKHETTK